MTRHMIRRHPIATFLVILILSPYIAAIALLYAAGFAVAVLLDTLGGRR